MKDGRFRMKKVGAAAGLMVVAVAIGTSISTRTAAKETPRPKIIGITHVDILTTNEKKGDDFYYGVMKALEARVDSEPCHWCEGAPIRGTYPLDLKVVKGRLPSDLIVSVTFQTDDVEVLRKYLKQKGVHVGSLKETTDGKSFSVSDPEHHIVIFLQRQPPDSLSQAGFPGAYASPPRWPPLIHMGWVVKDRGAMDKFYRDVLGFHLYWQGGMKDERVDWVSMQVPDGTDWIEYMLNVPADADKHLLGVMNHIALGVASVQAAAEQLKKNGVKLTEEPKIGRDGKWQLNLYDPDDTRVELMEFTPVEKPCCAEFTGTHPKP